MKEMKMMFEGIGNENGGTKMILEVMDKRLEEMKMK